MPKPKLPVVAAVPNYNMGKSLEVLLPQLIKQNYDSIYVLDDASTDDSKAIVKKFASQVTFVAGDKNSGAGANRNRIIPHIKTKSIIHFIDADMRLETQDIPELARKIMHSKKIGFIVGLVKENGRQHPYNFGPKPRLKKILSSQLYYHITRMAKKNNSRAYRLHKQFDRHFSGRPNIFNPASKMQTFWGSEANILFDSDVFIEMGGFDETLREHEILDLGVRLENAGYSQWFDPQIAANHMKLKVRPRGRKMTRRLTAAKIAYKHVVKRHQKK